MTWSRDGGSRGGLASSIKAATVAAVLVGGCLAQSAGPSASPAGPASPTASPAASGEATPPATEGPTSRPTPRPTERIFEYDGDASGRTDVTADLQRYIDETPDGSTIRFYDGGRYRLDCTIWVSGRTSLTIDGAGATFSAPETPCESQTMWRFHGGQGHVIRDMTIEGSHAAPGTYVPAFEFQAGVETLGTSDIEISDIVLRRLYGDCIHVGHNNQRGGDWEWSSDVAIRRIDCSGTGRQGIAITGARDVLIEHSTFSEQGFIVLDIEPDQPPNGAIGVNFRDNVVFGRVASQFVSIGGTGDVSDVVVERNQVLDGPNHGIWTVIEPLGGYRRRNIVIRDNVSAATFSAGRRQAVFVVRSTEGATISGNVQPREVTHLLLAEITDSCGIVLAANDPVGLVVGDGHDEPC
jgi:hypothetical protein